MKRGGPIAIDTETTGLDIMRDRVLCWSLATDKARYFLGYEFLWLFDPLFSRKDVIWFLANAKYDLHILANMGCSLAGPVYDIIVMDAMEDDTRAHGLKAQAEIAYGVKWGDFKDLFLDPEHVSRALGLDRTAFPRFKKMSVGDRLMFVWNEAPAIVENYASCDAFFTYLRGEDLLTQLAAFPLPTKMVEGFDTLLDYFEVIEAPFTKVLWRMERTGAAIDLDRVAKIDTPLREGIRAQERKLHALMGKDYNPSSAAELREILFTKQGFNLRPVGYTAKGKTPTASTAEKDLKLLQSRLRDNPRAHDFIEEQLKYSHLAKLHSTFVKKVRTYLGPDGCMHSRYNQAIARTGRLTSSDPNLQNLPIRNDEFKIRGMFVAHPGHHLMDCDYPQIQPRLAAILAPEPNMLENIRRGWDIHSANAFKMYSPQMSSVTYEAITEAKEAKEARTRALRAEEAALLKLRDAAKTVGLGVLFGEGAGKMAHQLKISQQEAQGHINSFFAAYPNIKRSIDDAHDYAHDYEFMYTMLGRIRRMHRINNPYSMGVAASEERQAYNHLIQGSEAELMKCAMLRIDADPDWNALGGKLTMNVHDELLSIAPKDTSAECFAIKKALMADPLQWGPIRIKLPIPIDPDGGVGDRWSDIH
jgi:DNA polymerase-1